MSELTREQAREKCHELLVGGLRLIRPSERIRAIAEAFHEVETREKRQSAEPVVRH